MVPAWLVSIGVSAALGIGAAYLGRNENLPEELTEQTVPEYQEPHPKFGDPKPVIFGTVRVHNPAVLRWWNPVIIAKDLG